MHEGGQRLEPPVIRFDSIAMSGQTFPDAGRASGPRAYDDPQR